MELRVSNATPRRHGAIWDEGRFGSTNWAQPCRTEVGRVKKRWSNIVQRKLWSWFHELGPPTMNMVLAMVTATMAGKEKPNERWAYRLHGG